MSLRAKRVIITMAALAALIGLWRFGFGRISLDANIVTITIAALTALIGLWRFNVERRQANLQPFLQKQLELVFQATDTVARLATETDPDEWEKARIVFWRLYWGTLCIVEDYNVTKAMHIVGDLVPKEPVKVLNLPMRSLGNPSIALAHAIRALVLRSWSVNLPPLNTPETQDQTNPKEQAEKKLTEPTT